MGTQNTDSFYEDLPAFDRFAEVVEPHHYRAVPEDWFVAMTDVIGSTKAIEAGRYKAVNALGAASITAILNACEGRDIPFVFGGDGATALIPPSTKDGVTQALAGLRALARDAFGMSLRAGIVSVAEIVRDTGPILVARYLASPTAALAMFSGRGLQHADTLLKATADRFSIDPDESATVDLEGFQCRWKPIQNHRGHILSALIEAKGPDARQRETYRAILDHIDRLIAPQSPHPAPAQSLHLSEAIADLDTEVALRTGQNGGIAFKLHRQKLRAQVVMARRLLDGGKKMGSFDGDTYRAEVSSNTDFRKFDGMLRMVIDVSSDELSAIETYLEAARARGELVYGLQLSGAALMTCMVFNYTGRHLHFVDGSDGGYALAARQLKRQLKQG